LYSQAITRKPCKNFGAGITSSNLGKPDYSLMLQQHHAYVDTLNNLGLQVTELEVLDDYPDAHFVEDTAVVVPEIVIIARPGAKIRRGEEITIEDELAKYKNIEKIKAPGTVDGGDVLITGKKVYIGISERTNREGANQLSEILKKFGYDSTYISVNKGLHLKSDVNYIGKNTVLMTDNFFYTQDFKSYNKIIVKPEESYAANSLLVNNKLLIPKGFADTKLRLLQAEFDVFELDMSEAQKMDGGLTCFSLRF
jgi:dimethylargininase